MAHQCIWVGSICLACVDNEVVLFSTHGDFVIFCSKENIELQAVYDRLCVGMNLLRSAPLTHETNQFTTLNCCKNITLHLNKDSVVITSAANLASLILFEHDRFKLCHGFFVDIRPGFELIGCSIVYNVDLESPKLQQDLTSPLSRTLPH